MDNPAHAPLKKQCFECRQWLLLTNANWPKTSRENPCKSCCRSCSNTLEVDESVSGKDGIDAGLDLLKLNEEQEPETSSLYASCQEKTSSSSSDDTCSTTTSNQIVHSVTTEDPSSPALDKERDPSCSTMASRWAFKTEDEGRSPSATSHPVKASRKWFKAREDLFSGHATVDNASPDLFKNLTAQPERRPVASKTIKSGEEYTKGLNSKPQSPLNRCDDDINKKARSPQKPPILTGANRLAIEGDNGWGDRTNRMMVMDKFKSNLPSARNYDTSPHYLYKRYLQDESKGNDSGCAMSPEIRRQLADPSQSNLTDHTSELPSHKVNTDYLLEAIARMERENMSMLAPLHAATPSRDIDIHHDAPRYDQSASGWD